MQAFVETRPPVQRAILASVQLQSATREDVEESLQELGRLADTAGIQVVGETIHPRLTPHVAYYIGPGKVDEIKGMAEELRADVLIFDEELSPAQTRNLEKALDRLVMDRTSLILDIFAQRARTRVAKVQVELAQLQYALPRLTRQWTHLSRLGGGAGGGVKGGVGTRGTGETQLQIDRQLIRTRISQLRRRLEKVEKQRRTQRKHRHNVPTVALVGYTNAGKSTLLNTLTGEDVFVEDKLFATLDPTTRTMELPNGQKALLTDTVGFIHKLPHPLVASFHATLEEVLEADLLLHVLDASHPRALQHAEAVRHVLEELEADGQPRWMLLNKHDRIKDLTTLNILRHHYPDALVISGLTGFGLDALKQELADHFASVEVELSLVLSHRDGQVLNYLYTYGEIVDRRYESNDVLVEARLPEDLLGQFRTMIEGTSVQMR